MRKLFLIILLTCLSATAVAQSGIYMDKERNGEGITLFDWTNLHQENVVTFYFYTYDSHNSQRWFFGSDLVVDNKATGKLYVTKGVNYPEGEPSNLPFEEDVVIVGVPVAVGTYTLVGNAEGGYLLWVERLDEVENLDRDYLYDRSWLFTYPLIQLK